MVIKMLLTIPIVESRLENRHETMSKVDYNFMIISILVHSLINANSLNEYYAVPRRRGPRRPRPPMRGIMLDAMTKSMGRRLPISVEQGKRRPSDPVQAAKLASEAGVVVRAEVPILTHWKEYQKDNDSFDNFIGKLAVNAYIYPPRLYGTLHCDMSCCNSLIVAIDLTRDGKVDRPKEPGMWCSIPTTFSFSTYQCF